MRNDKKIDKVLMALQVLCNYECSSSPLPSQTLWPQTRQVADFCDMNIFTCRRYLMKLVKSNQAYVSAGLINNSWRWYIAAATPLSGDL
jgi:hypothetical protein